MQMSSLIFWPMVYSIMCIRSGQLIRPHHSSPSPLTPLWPSDLWGNGKLCVLSVHSGQNNSAFCSKWSLVFELKLPSFFVFFSRRHCNHSQGLWACLSRKQGKRITKVHLTFNVTRLIYPTPGIIIVLASPSENRTSVKQKELHGAHSEGFILAWPRN